MARPKSPVPMAAKNLSLPANLQTEIDLLLYSELEQRVPLGAWSELVTRLLMTHLRKSRARAARAAAAQQAQSPEN